MASYANLMIHFISVRGFAFSDLVSDTYIHMLIW